MDFGRTMNQIVMEKFMELPPEESKDMIPHGLTMPPRMPPRKVPYFGQITIPPHDFATQFSNFCFNSLYIKEEVINATNEIRHECNNLLKSNQIWNTKIDENGGEKKVLRIEEFKQLQSSAIQMMKFNTGKDAGWVGKLEKSIKQHFSKVGKGWFNIEENSKETYEFGKLKKFLMMVNFMMQDTVLNLCKNSVHEFLDFMLSYIPDETLITNTATVKNVYKNRQLEKEDSDDEIPVFDSDLEGVKACKIWVNRTFKKNKDPEPLFQLDLIPPKQGQLIPNFNNTPESVVKKVQEIFEEGIKSLQEIPQLEPILLHRLFRNKSKKNIKAPTIPVEEPKEPENVKGKVRQLIDENVWLWHAFEKLNKNMMRAIKPLEEYVKTFGNFQAENELSADAWIQKIEEMPENERWSPERIKEDIYEHKRLEQILLNRIPESITVSMFKINCNDIRNMYAQKYRDIVEKEIFMIAGLAKSRNTQLTEEFKEITRRVTEQPQNIDELDQIKNFINECGVKIKKK
jgi:dynein heavy chain